MLTRNPVLCSLIGAAIANMMAQFGIAPMDMLPYCTTLFGGTLLIWMEQSKWFERGVQSFNLKAWGA